MSSAEVSSLRLCSFESRRADQMRSLIERQGGVAMVVPSMREVPLDENDTALDFAQRLLDGQVDVVVFMTGVGARSLLDAAETKFERQEFLKALDACRIAIRGPKPATVLREWGVHIDCRAAEPNTWHELLAVMDGNVAVSGKTVAVQEYGEPNEEFYDALRQRGADVLPVPVYRWAFPDEQQPLADAIEATIAGRFDAILFTSAFQLSSVLHTADGIGCRDEWIAAANNCVVASIGPTASEAMRRAGLTIDIEADPPKMGQLVRAVIERGREIVNRKRGDAP
jgi:uroporphyrinogen-III synthase